MTRRGLLKSSAGLALASALDTGEPAHAAQQPRKPNVYEALGVRPVINAFGTITYRPEDQQSTMGAFIGKTKNDNGKGTMVDYRYLDGAKYLPGGDEIRKMRAQD